MYSISKTKTFKKSYEKVKNSGKFKKQTTEKLEKVINTLASGKSLPKECRDHQLAGEFSNYRECHIKGDLLLIYQIKKEELILVLINIGTHSYLGV